MDGICDQMKNYIYATFTISASGNTTQQWDKWMGKDATAMINSTRWVAGSCGRHLASASSCHSAVVSDLAGAVFIERGLLA